MNGDQKFVSYDDIESINGNLSNIASELENSFENLSASFSDFSSAWTGIAASNCNGAIKTAISNLAPAHAELANNSLFLISVANAYSKVGEESVNKLAQIRDNSNYSAGSQNGYGSLVLNHKPLVTTVGEITPVRPVIETESTPSTPSTPQTSPNTGATYDVHSIALRVINGDYGVGEDRKARLRKDGYDPKTVQEEVNNILKGGN